MEDKKEIRDAVHGQIDLHPLCVLIVDTPQFQRLRNISQCGLSHLVYPSACHSRFEHSLGVYHLAGLMLKKIKENVKSEKIDEVDELCVQIAALCHDLGHGPFSHLWETFLKRCGKPSFTHEKMSVNIFKDLIERNQLSEKFTMYQITEEKINFIGRLILGKPVKNDELNEKRYLFEIVANSETGVDVDKWDYMLRDALHFGVKIELNYDRILSTTSVTNKIINKDGKGPKHITFRDKVAKNVKEMFETRTKLHQICYQHNVSKIIEMMLLDALLEFDKNYLVKLKNGEKVKLSECQDNLEAFLKISDYLYYELLNSIDDKFEEGRKIIERIVRRKLYTLLYATFVDIKDFSEEKLKEKIEQLTNKFKKEDGESKYLFKFTCIDLNIDRWKIENILCYNKNFDIIPFPEEIKSYGIKVIVMCTSYKSDIDSEDLKLMKDHFEQQCF